MSSSTVSASASTWATMAKDNGAGASKGGNNNVRVTISDCPVVDNWDLPKGATPTVVSTHVPSDATGTSDNTNVQTTDGSKEPEEVFIGKATIARRARGRSVVIGNHTGVNHIRCNYCSQLGHSQKECGSKIADKAAEREAGYEAYLQRKARRDAKAQAFQEREERRKHVTCYRCGEVGHFKVECVNPSKQEQAKAALEARIDFAMAEGMTREEAIAGETALATYKAREEEATRLARAQSTRAQRKKTELVIGADQGSYELTNGGIVGAFKGYKA